MRMRRTRPKWHVMDGTAGESNFNTNGVDNHGGAEVFFYWPASGVKTGVDDEDHFVDLYNIDFNFDGKREKS